MKINSGFVSNSSTSSFICLGWHMSKSNLEELLLKYLDSKNVQYDKDVFEKHTYFDSVMDELIEYDNHISELKVYSDDYDVTFGKEMYTADINELKHYIAEFEEKCNDEKHIYHYFKKLREPSFIVEAIIDY